MLSKCANVARSFQRVPVERDLKIIKLKGILKDREVLSVRGSPRGAHIAPAWSLNAQFTQKYLIQKNSHAQKNMKKINFKKRRLGRPASSFYNSWQRSIHKSADRIFKKLLNIGVNFLLQLFSPN
jgi:hypothetical protein